MDLPPSSNSRPQLLLVLCLALVALYLGSHSFWYSTTSLGLVPVLDGKENCQLALQISEGKLPHEPFYRAPLYPIILAAAFKLGATEASLPHVARLINAVAHLVSATLIFYIGLRLWRRTRAAVFSALLFGLNPVLIFFASDPLDITMAITCMLAGLLCGLKAIDKNNHHFVRSTLLAGLFFGLASLLRSHFLMLACAWPIIAYLFSRRSACFFAALSAPFVGLITLGLINMISCNEWVILPTQGPFNLWAANKANANGRYFEQSMQIKTNGAYKNPARIESEFIYYQAVESTTPAPITRINAFWRAQTWSLIKNHPKTFLKGLLKKSVFLLRDHENYNNKTFWVHKELSPALNWNPLCWSALLCLGTIGLISHLSRKDLTFIALCGIIFASGVILFYVSARFRLPLTAFLSIFAGGILTLSKEKLKRPAFWIACIFAIGLTTLSTIPLLHAKNGATEAEDYLLLAQSSAELGWDDEAYGWALDAYAIAPNREATLELLVTSFYNKLIVGLPQIPPESDIEDSLLIAMRILPSHPETAYIIGTYLWILGDESGATHFWRQLVRVQGPGAQNALSALILTQKINSREREYLRQIPSGKKSVMLLLAESMQGNTRTELILKKRIPPQAIALEEKRLRALFSK